MKFSVLVISIIAMFAMLSSPLIAEDNKGGIVPGIASCCLIGMPGGQLQNSGVNIPSRSWARILIIPAIIDGVKAYNGETAEEYLKVSSLPTTSIGKGGVGNAFLSACCWAGLPAGHLMNSGQNIPARAWLRIVPYVGGIVALYDGYKAYGGETMSGYAEIK